MVKTTLTPLFAASLALLLASQAHALSLTNRDTSDQTVTISEGGDEATTKEVVIEADQTINELCPEGCTIALESGQQESFAGDETVYIEDGRFVIAE